MCDYLHGMLSGRYELICWLRRGVINRIVPLYLFVVYNKSSKFAPIFKCKINYDNNE